MFNRPAIIFSAALFVFVVQMPAAPPSVLPTPEPQADTIKMELRPVVHVDGEVGRPYILQFSDSLAADAAWNVATPFVMPKAGFDFVDPRNSGATQRFYRAVPGTVIASSVMDYSTTQGSNNWFYGYYPEPYATTNFVELTRVDGEIWKPDGLRVWTSVSRMEQHPNGTYTSYGRTKVEHWAVRRWRIPVTQKVNVSIFIRDMCAENGNGVVARVFLDGEEKGNFPIENGRERWEALSLEVRAGSLLDFVVDPHEGNDLCDRTELTVVIY